MRPTGSQEDCHNRSLSLPVLLQAEVRHHSRALAKSILPKANAPQETAEPDSFLLKPLKTRDAAQMGVSAQPERKVHSPTEASGGGRGRGRGRGRGGNQKTEIKKAAPGGAEAEARGLSKPGRGRYIGQSLPQQHLVPTQRLGLYKALSENISIFLRIPRNHKVCTWDVFG